MCCEEEAPPAAASTQIYWKNDCIFVSLITLFTVAYLGIAILGLQMGSPSLATPPAHGSFDFFDSCNVQVVAASVTRAIEFVCSETPITTNGRRPKLDVNCSNIHQESGNHPMYCNPITNRCAPYCVERRERLGVVHLFECSWDATKLISNVTIVISPSNDKLNRNYSYNEVAQVIGHLPAHLSSQVDRGISERAISFGLFSVAYCVYRVDGAGGVISDGKISLLSPGGFVALYILLITLVSIIYAISMVVTLHAGGTESLKRIYSYTVSLTGNYQKQHFLRPLVALLAIITALYVLPGLGLFLTSLLLAYVFLSIL